MSGLLELITLADRWRQWSDPRFVVLVLHNRDLTEVSWEQREMEGNPRFPASQQVPEFPYAQYAELLGLGSARITESGQAAAAWRQALGADRPFIIEAVVDAATPLLPPLMPDEKADKVVDALRREDDGGPASDRVGAGDRRAPRAWVAAASGLRQVVDVVERERRRATPAHRVDPTACAR